MMKVDDELKRTDALLYQMIPKMVADRLRQGEPAIKTCQVGESDRLQQGEPAFKTCQGVNQIDCNRGSQPSKHAKWVSQINCNRKNHTRQTVTEATRLTVAGRTR